MHTQKTPMLKRLIVGSVLSGLLFGFGGVIANISQAQAQPVQNSIQQQVGPRFLQENSPYRGGERYNHQRHYWERYDNKRHGWYRFNKENLH